MLLNPFPSLDLAKLSQYFRAGMVDFFLKHTLLNKRLARNMLDWTHSGFRVDLSVKIPATSSKAREAFAQYTARPPVSLKKMLVEEHAGSVMYRSEYNPYFRTNSKLFPATEFLVEVLQHLPDAGARFIRRYGLYSSRSRGTWSRKPHLLRLAPDGWKKDHQSRPALHLGPAPQDTPNLSVSATESRSAWARLLAKIYEVDLIGGSCLRSKQREPAALPPLWFPDAGPGRHHRSPADPQNPPPPHQDRRGSPGP